MIDGAAALQSKLARFDKDLDKIGWEVAKASVPDVAAVVRSGFGDLSLSKWYGGGVEMVGEVMRQPDGSVAVQPVRSARGEMRVATDGRQAYAVGDRRASGFSRSGGQKTRRVRRAGGRSSGRGTWGTVEATIKDRLPGRAQRALHEVMAGIFTKG